MRRPILNFAAAAAVVLLAPAGEAFAQLGGTGVGADPFSFYYGYYLPHAAAIAAQPTPLDTINQVQANRQRAAATDRTALYDPISPYGDESDDPTKPFGNRRSLERRSRLGSAATPYGAIKTNAPTSHFNRTAQYFPGLRSGRGPNMNVSASRGPRGGGMGAMGGMGGMGGFGGAG